MIKKIISGGQTGADIAGLEVAKSYELETGGWLTKGCRTLDGPKPEYKKLYDMQENDTYSYKDRTWKNVADADGTIRFAKDFYSPGERCTLNAINFFKKPYFDVDVTIQNRVYFQRLKEWISTNNISILNVAGNSEQTAPGINDYVFMFLVDFLDQKWSNA